ncbi:hsp70 nucleotide exchange factor fes1 [Ceratobasidium sp. 392]|nr:hsp70 nucleotide exchange factor fes1 [Ceratobasidium sp. 392]
MESILKWSIENTPEDAPRTAPSAERMKELDPEIIDMILGKSDAVVMKEKLAFALDEAREEDERVEALDDVEMLVEQIDNANNLENLKMWEPLLGLMRSPVIGVQRHAIWIVGTAVQNNATAQEAFLKRDPIPHLLSLLTSGDCSGSTRSKVLYCLSGALKHNAQAVRQLDKAGGWEAFKHALQDPDITVRRKTAFLLNTLLLQDTTTGSTAAALHSSDGPQTHGAVVATEVPSTQGLVRTAIADHGLISALVQPPPYGTDGDLQATDDADYCDKALMALDTYEGNGGDFGDAKQAVAEFRQARVA